MEEKWDIFSKTILKYWLFLMTRFHVRIVVKYENIKTWDSSTLNTFIEIVSSILEIIWKLEKIVETTAHFKATYILIAIRIRAHI